MINKVTIVLDKFDWTTWSAYGKKICVLGVLRLLRKLKKIGTLKFSSFGDDLPSNLVEVVANPGEGEYWRFKFVTGGNRNIKVDSHRIKYILK